MPIKTIEIICLPCPKCEQLKPKISEIIRGIEVQNKLKIIYEFKHTPSLRDVSKYGLSPSQTPVIVINGNAEFAGRVDHLALKKKIEMVNRS